MSWPLWTTCSASRRQLAERVVYIEAAGSRRRTARGACLLLWFSRLGSLLSVPTPWQIGHNGAPSSGAGRFIPLTEVAHVAGARQRCFAASSPAISVTVRTLHAA